MAVKKACILRKGTAGPPAKWHDGQACGGIVYLLFACAALAYRRLLLHAKQGGLRAPRSISAAYGFNPDGTAVGRGCVWQTQGNLNRTAMREYA